MLHLRHSAEARDLKMASDRDHFSSIAEMMEWYDGMTNSVSNEFQPLAVHLRLFFPLPKHFTPREMLSSLRRHSHGRRQTGKRNGGTLLLGQAQSGPVNMVKIIPEGRKIQSFLQFFGLCNSWFNSSIPDYVPRCLLFWAKGSCYSGCVPNIQKEWQI